MPSKKESKNIFDKIVIQKKLRFKFPDSKIIFNPENEPTEIIAEVEPTIQHPEYSVAVAVLGQSEPHHHDHTTETYRVLSGLVELHLGERAVELFAGQEEVVQPGTVHWAKSINGDSWVRVTSEPGWTAHDHILETGNGANNG